MTTHEIPGLLRRMLTALGGALKRAILGKSAHDYMKQFTGSHEYWDRVIAAQVGWSQKQLSRPDPAQNLVPAGRKLVHARKGRSDQWDTTGQAQLARQD